MCYTPPCENSLSPSVLNANASTSPFIFIEPIHSFDYNHYQSTQQKHAQQSKSSKFHDISKDQGHTASIIDKMSGNIF